MTQHIMFDFFHIYVHQNNTIYRSLLTNLNFTVAKVSTN